MGIKRDQSKLPQSKPAAFLLIKPSAAWKLVDDALESALDFRRMSSQPQAVRCVTI